MREVSNYDIKFPPPPQAFLRLRGEHLPQNSENKPRGLYFSKTLFEGLIFGGAYLLFSAFYGTYHKSGMLETSQKREWGVMRRKTERRESRLAFSSLLITTFDLAFLNEYFKLCSGMTVKVYLNDIILSKFGDYMVSIFYS